MAVTKSELLDTLERHRRCMDQVYMQKSDESGTVMRVVVSATEPEDKTVIWIKPIE